MMRLLFTKSTDASDASPAVQILTVKLCTRPSEREQVLAFSHPFALVAHNQLLSARADFQEESRNTGEPLADSFVTCTSAPWIMARMMSGTNVDCMTASPQL
jgi:hypothetical protein